MKTSRKLLTGLVLSTGLIGSGCATVVRPVAQAVPAADDACRYASQGTPQVMIFDSYTGTETHVDAQGKQTAMTVYGAHDETTVGVNGGGRQRGFICAGRMGAQTVVAERSGVNPVLIGAAAGAVTGALVTKSGKGAAEGAVIGGSLISTYSDPRKGEDITVGSAIGAAIGAAVTKDAKGAGVGAATGAVLGHETYDGERGGGRRDHDDD